MIVLGRRETGAWARHEPRTDSGDGTNNRINSHIWLIQGTVAITTGATDAHCKDSDWDRADQPERLPSQRSSPSQETVVEGHGARLEAVGLFMGVLAVGALHEGGGSPWLDIAEDVGWEASHLILSMLEAAAWDPTSDVTRQRTPPTGSSRKRTV